MSLIQELCATTLAAEANSPISTYAKSILPDIIASARAAAAEGFWRTHFALPDPLPFQDTNDQNELDHFASQLAAVKDLEGFYIRIYRLPRFQANSHQLMLILDWNPLS